jgi:hypothetical protein
MTRFTTMFPVRPVVAYKLFVSFSCGTETVLHSTEDQTLSVKTIPNV